MSNNGNGNGPPLVVHHPIPRRPFAVKTATLPDDSSFDKDTSPSSSFTSSTRAADRRQSETTAQFLDPRPQTDTDASPTPGGGGSESISRAQSIMNLTSSTLFGIFSPTSPSRGSVGGGANGIFESSTPWGTGTETPARDLLVEQNEDDDDETEGENGRNKNTNASAAEIDEVRKASQSLMELQRQRRRGESFGANGVPGIKLQPAPAGRTKSFSAAEPAQTSSGSRVLLFLSMTARAALLFTLGMGYGVIVSRLRSETHVSFHDLGESAPAPSPAETGPAPEYVASYDWRYLVSWGLSGIALGTLLPWFDGVWDRTFGRNGSVLAKARTAPETDWALVVRGIGAFAGVAFAMRKLPWASTMQASMTLALANPFLWYLLDRSKSGLLLAAVFGFVGSGALMALNLDLMPNPGMHSSPYHAGYGGSGMGGAFGGASFAKNDSTAPSDGNGSLNASAPAVTAETAVWMLSVLFCSCVCFGNIGRRLALQPAATAEGQ